MPRRAEVLNSLSRGRVRASMNKLNLFNLYKKPRTNFQGKTLYQQKWSSKTDTRAYHGEHLTESRWKQLFDPKLESVAQLDASLKGESVPPTPVTLQTFASLEKRLEFALFRAMFASSIRQARQFILAGDVRVNGVVVRHPSFPLRAGDLFHVSPDRVLQAMGRSKPNLAKSIKIDNLQIGAWNRYVKVARENPQEVWNVKKSKPQSLNTLNDHTKNSKESIKKFNEKLQKQMIQDQNNTTRESILTKIISASASADASAEASADLFVNVCGQNNSAKCLQIYQLLKKANHGLLSDKSKVAEFISKKSNEVSADEHKLAASVKQILSELVKTQTEFIRQLYNSQMLSESSKSLPYDPEFANKMILHPKLNKDEILEDERKATVNLPWQRGLFGRKDASKPFFTPWTPRPFIGCFAVLPHHLEISFDTCHAVYLRNPVARPGHSEVISPFPEAAHERAYMWYARKGQ